MFLWCDGRHGAVENMRRDAALLETAEAWGPGFEPVLRVFAFDPPGITLGMSQRPETALDLERCAADGVAWAVRPTGGRAIFHDAEWTYSLTASLEDPEFGGTLHDAYAATSRLLVGSLRRLGVAATLAPGRRRDHPESPHHSTTPCFASTASHEVVLEGRKLVGSAQRRTARALLQQGSVLLGPEHLRLTDYLALPAAERDREREKLARSSTWAAPETVSLEAWADALAGELGPVQRVTGDAGAALLTPVRAGFHTPRPMSDRVPQERGAARVPETA